MNTKVKSILALCVALFMLVTGLVAVPASAERSYFIRWTDADDAINPVNHVALSTATPEDGNYGNYHYAAQEFIPVNNNLSGVKLKFNLTAGSAKMHIEIREQANGDALLAKDIDINSLGDGGFWYTFNFGENVTLTPYNTYYIVWWATERTASSVMINYATDNSANTGPSGWVHGMTTDTFEKRSNVIFGFELITDVISDQVSFAKWTDADGNLGPVYHLALAGADESDSNYGNYQYVAQEVIPNNSNLSGFKVMLNLTAGTAKIHTEVRREMTGSPIYQKDIDIVSQGDGGFWYDLNFGQDLNVKPFETYYLLWWAVDRTPTSVTVVYATDNSANNGPCGWIHGMAQDSYARAKNLIFGFELDTEVTGVPAYTPAQLVSEKIAALPATDDLTLNDKAAVAEARAAYDDLKEEEKADVENFNVLQAAEEKIAQLEEIAAANDMKAAIDRLPDAEGISVIFENDVNSMLDKYNTFSDVAKETVTNYAKLNELKTAIDTLKEKLTDTKNALALKENASSALTPVGAQRGWRIKPGQSNHWAMYGFAHSFGEGTYKLAVRVKLGNLGAAPVLSLKTTDNTANGAEVLKKDLSFTDYDEATKDEDGFAMLYTDDFVVNAELASHVLEGKVFVYGEFHGEDMLVVIDGVYWVKADDTSVVYSKVENLSAWGAKNLEGSLYYDTEKPEYLEFTRDESKDADYEYGYSLDNINLGNLKKGKYAVELEYSALDGAGNMFEAEVWAGGQKVSSSLVSADAYKNSAKTANATTAVKVNFELESAADATFKVYQMNAATVRYYNVRFYELEVVNIDEAVQAVITLIDELPEAGSVAVSDTAKVKEAVDAYEGLTDEQKADVTNREKLDSVLAAYKGKRLGDVDANGEITATDALLALQAAVGKIELEGFDFFAANVDGNDKITSNDALLILQRSVGKLTSF